MKLLSGLPEEALGPSSRDALTEPRNAYEFIQRRKHAEGDPTLMSRNSRYVPRSRWSHGTLPSGKFL
ncbi:hypothetical protein BJV78DRAFT_1251773 [Lactifluus subvellereus]|nr:hypothetical protein BJV78DRAFT_1251773 [Lactifluus subvellereus]